MRRFIYFCAGLSGSPSRETFIRGTGLAYAFPKEESFTTCAVADGAMGPGVLAACGDGIGLKIDAKAQDWHEIKAGVFVAVSRDKALWPTPDELARDVRSLDGHAVTLGDGNEWSIPVVRFLNGLTQLPQILMKKDGRAVWAVKPEFEELVNSAEKIVADLLNGDQTAYDPAEMLWFCTAALQVNYRIGEEEIAALGLINSENVRDIANAALDGHSLATLIEEFKKKQNAAVPSGMECVAGANA